MMNRRRPSLRRNQRGFVLIALVALLAMGGLYFFISNLSPELVNARRQQQTSEVLTQAREALIGYAIQYREQQRASGGTDNAMYGFLPMPDTGTSRFHASQACKLEGCAMSFMNGAFPATTDTVIGRFPWRTLGTAPLRDGNGECLWYIVSANFKNLGINGGLTMNWDTLSQLEVVIADGTTNLTPAAIASFHERPIAIIFAPGPPLAGQDRGTSSTDSVTECGGNYAVTNYLDPAVGSNLGFTNYLTGTNNASGDTSTANKSLSAGGMVSRRGDGNLWAGDCPPNDASGCKVVANDVGAAVGSEMLFRTLRGSSYFRTDINSMLSAMGSCLEPAVAFTPQAISGTADATRGKVPDVAKCSIVENNAAGYFDNYREQVLAAVAADINACKTSFSVPGNCLDVTIRDTTQNSVTRKKCHAVLILGGQRGPGQTRVSDANRKTPGNYLEGDNLTSFTTGGRTAYSGARQFTAVSSTSPAYQDVVRCIPEAGYSATNISGDPFQGIQNAALTPYGGQLTGYDTVTGTITLGREFASALPSAVRTDAYGCTWQPDTHAFTGGLRSYFKFRINDSLNPLATTPLDGFTFAIVDADNNGIGACGAARQHLGYSGNNMDTPYIKPPKIGIEVDLRRNFSGTGFTPSGTNTLTNGRSDPSYTGGHVGIVYWGGEAPIATTILPASCFAPRVLVGGICYLASEEDDNVHGYPAAVSGCRPAPANPAAPATPTLSSGVYKLDPSLGSVPTNQDFHVRVEITRAATAPGTTPTLPAVRIATTANIDLTQPGVAIDGVTLANGDRMLVRAQTLASQSGVYVWGGATTPAVRAIDFDSAKELAGAIVTVAEGTQNGGTTWRQSAIYPTPNADAEYWADLRARVASQSNLDLTLPVTSIDNVTLTSGDRVLVKAQTTSAENGVYLWTDAATPLSRATDADTATKRTGMIVQVVEGTSARAWWLSDGTTWSRQSVRVATQSNIDLASPGNTIDGCTVMAAGDRVLVRAQTDSTRNGIYLWQGSSSPMTRASDADDLNKLNGAITQVLEGTDVDRAFRQTETFDPLDPLNIIDTKAVLWSALDSIAAPQFIVEAWILPDSVTDANRIAAMKNTSRPMRNLDASFTPHLHDAPAIYNAFRRARLGFTIGQSTSRNDQTVAITNLFTTWLD